jgi:hypothetical protein
MEDATTHLSPGGCVLYPQKYRCCDSSPLPRRAAIKNGHLTKVFSRRCEMTLNSFYADIIMCLPG